MNQELLKKLAMLMYDNYCMAVGGLAFNGDKLPTSEEFFADASKQKQIDGWMSSAASAVTFAETNPEIITDGVLRQKADKWDADFEDRTTRNLELVGNFADYINQSSSLSITEEKIIAFFEE